MLEFLEDAAVELELAVGWYDTQRPSLGTEFPESAFRCLSFPVTRDPVSRDYP